MLLNINLINHDIFKNINIINAQQTQLHTLTNKAAIE